MAKKSSKKTVPSGVLGLFGLMLVALILAYIAASRALDTGSWWEYGYAVALLIFALNRFITAISRLRLHLKKS